MKLLQILLYCSLLSLTVTTMATEKPKQDKDKTPAKAEKPKAVSTGDAIYTWTDKWGNKIYSDVPRDGAEVMKIDKGTDYTPPAAETNYSTMKPKVVAVEKKYSHFEIASPSNEATIRDNNGNIQVALDIRPKLMAGDKIKLEMDGKEVKGSGTSIIALSNIDRGEHTLVAYIVAVDGSIRATTPAVTVYLHRNSIIRAKGG